MQLGPLMYVVGSWLFMFSEASLVEFISLMTSDLFVVVVSLASIPMSTSWFSCCHCLICCMRSSISVFRGLGRSLFLLRKIRHCWLWHVVLLVLLEGVGRYTARIISWRLCFVSMRNPDHLPMPVGSVTLALILPVHGPWIVHAVPPGW